MGVRSPCPYPGRASVRLLQPDHCPQTKAPSQCPGSHPPPHPSPHTHCCPLPAHRKYQPPLLPSTPPHTPTAVHFPLTGSTSHPPPPLPTHPLLSTSRSPEVPATPPPLHPSPHTHCCPLPAHRKYQPPLLPSTPPHTPTAVHFPLTGSTSHPLHPSPHPSPHTHCCPLSDHRRYQPPSGSESPRWCCLLVGCLKSQQQASVSQGRICSDNVTCCLTEIEVADPTFYLTQSQYTDTGPTSPSTDPITPGAWTGSH